MSAVLRSSSEERPLFLCIGDIDVDVLIGVDRLPTRDGKVNGGVCRKRRAAWPAMLRPPLPGSAPESRILGRVGDDPDGEFAVAALDRAGVDTSFISRLAGAQTFSCISLLTPDGENR